MILSRSARYYAARWCCRAPFTCFMSSLFHRRLLFVFPMLARRSMICLLILFFTAATPLLPRLFIMPDMLLFPRHFAMPLIFRHICRRRYIYGITFFRAIVFAVSFFDAVYYCCHHFRHLLCRLPLCLFFFHIRATIHIIILRHTDCCYVYLFIDIDAHDLSLLTARADWCRVMPL